MSTERNKAIVRRYFEEVHNQRQTALLDEIMTADLVEPTRGVIAGMLTAFPDYEITVTDQVAEADRVATVWSMRGTHRGEWDSPAGRIAASGNRVSYTGTTTLRVVDARITEVLGSNHDHLGLLQQIGHVPAVAPRSGA